MDALARKTRRTDGGRRSRVVLTPRRWRQVGDDTAYHASDDASHHTSDDAFASRWRWWQQSPVTRKSTKETVKTIAQGMPA
jgi:uncharacterized protein YraI